MFPKSKMKIIKTYINMLILFHSKQPRYFGVNEYLCLTGFTIFAVLVAGYEFLK